MSATITITEKRNDDGSMDISLVADNSNATKSENECLQQLMKSIAIALYQAESDDDEEEDYE